jgi:dihydropteroate synthase
MDYWRPIPMTDAARPPGSLPLAGGWCWFDRVEVLRRGAEPQVRPASDLPPDLRDSLTRPRAPLAGLTLDRPRLMGIVNVTPDSFSDGGQFFDPAVAATHGRALVAAGAQIVDIGGESTRPGAADVPETDEIARTAPVIAALRAALPGTVLSIDTRKAAVARAALDAGAGIVNDVSALTHDPEVASVVGAAGVPVVLMHARGTPRTMQDDPRYDDVLLDVYDHLALRIAAARAAGIPEDRIVIDPGIGFGKTAAHNLALIRRLSLFHALGCPVMLGASRKRFIGTIAGVPEAGRRVAGSVAVALAGIAQGAQILRVHDVDETRQAAAVWAALIEGNGA